MSEMNYQSVADFYAEKSIFITGGAGFLGKVIIEKLLYTCVDVDKIYMLIRDKKGVTAKERLQQILNKPLFSRLREKRPDDFKKIIPVNGDITLPNLGINPKELEELKNKISVVIHSAATVKFNEPLTIAMKVNVEGTRNVLNLCHQMNNIKVFVYISTAYSNTLKPEIEEKLYPPPVTIEEVYDFISKYGDDAKSTVKFLNGRPNTYTFTKALAENLVADCRGHIPTIIVRPSTVTPSKSEPLVGWVDNFWGATTVLALTAKGLMRTLYGNGDELLDLVPVDYVSNITLVATAKETSANEVKVYNCCLNSCNRISTRKLVEIYVKESIKNRICTLPFPGLLFITNEWKVRIISCLMIIFASLFDAFQWITGKTMCYRKYVSQAHCVRDTLKYFSTHSWTMKSDNSRGLHETLSPRDKVLFCCDFSDIDWETYVKNYFYGVEKYLLGPNVKIKEHDNKNSI